MNKAELISAVAEKTGLSKKDTEKVITATVDAITAELIAGEKVSLVGFGSFDVKSDKVQLVGFGSFETKQREGRTGRNPKTKEEIWIPASRIPQFKAGKALKDAVAK